MRCAFTPKGGNFDGIPSLIPYPKNLAIVGTINMDETTHGLSDKVLDRAFTLEFSSFDMSAYDGWKHDGTTPETRQRLTLVLSELLAALQPARLHFGWRVVDDIVDFVSMGERESDASHVPALLDAVVCAKVIPKLRGADTALFKTALQQMQETLQRHGLVQSHRRVKELAEDLALAGSARFWR